MHANEFETKEKQKLTEIINKLQHIHLHVHSGRVPRMMVKFNLEISESLSKVF